MLYCQRCSRAARGGRCTRCESVFRTRIPTPALVALGCVLVWLISSLL